MKTGEAKVSGTDAVIFPSKFAEKNQESVLAVEAENPAVEKESTKIKIQHRFARLKKSLRKRSAGIL